MAWVRGASPKIGVLSSGWVSPSLLRSAEPREVTRRWLRAALIPPGVSRVGPASARALGGSVLGAPMAGHGQGDGACPWAPRQHRRAQRGRHRSIHAGKARHHRAPARDRSATLVTSTVTTSGHRFSFSEGPAGVPPHCVFLPSPCSASALVLSGLCLLGKLRHAVHGQEANRVLFPLHPALRGMECRATATAREGTCAPSVSPKTRRYWGD